MYEFLNHFPKKDFQTMTAYDENGFLSGHIETWIEENRASHRDILKNAEDLNRHCHQFIDARSVDLDDEKQIVTCVLFARMVELYQAIIIAAERGMATPSRVLFRSFIEAFYHFSAIHEDSDYLKDYLNQLHFKRRKLVRGIKDSTSPELEHLRQAITDELVAEIDEAIQTIREEGVREITVKSSAERAGLLDIYITTYAILSSTAHTSAKDLEAHIIFNQETQRIEEFKYGPSQEETARSICLSSMWIAKALEIVSETFGEDRKNLCASYTESFQALLENANQESTD